MKKTIAILLSVSCLFGLNSCFKTEDDIFSDSPAQRLNKLESNYREVLSGATDGWVLQYFPSETEQGYPFIVKFEKNGKVTIAGNNSVSTGGSYKEETSTYDFVQDMSVVLTFDTYNTILHEFSSPQSDGVGHGGDYEFQVQSMSENQDTIYLMGKKTYIPMRLVRFPKGASYTNAAGNTATIDSWADYFTAIKANTDRLFRSGINGYTLVCGSETYDVNGMASGVMSIAPHGIPETEVSARTVYRGIIVNLDNSIYLSSPYTGENDNFSVRTFTINSDNSKMLSPDGTVTIEGPSTMSLFIAIDGVNWIIDPATLSDGLKTLYDAAAASAAAKNRTIEAGFAYSSRYGVCVIVKLYQKGATKPSEALFETTATFADDGTVEFEIDGSGDRNAQSYSKSLPGLLDYVKALAGSYSVTAVTPFIPTQLNFVSKTDSNVKFSANYNL